jgi:small subunit ribosomal protein S9
VINNKNFADYFQPLHSEHAIEPLVVTSTGGMYDVWATVKGGGLMAQSGAIRLGLARALQVQEPFLRPTLKKGELPVLTLSMPYEQFCILA